MSCRPAFLAVLLAATAAPVLAQPAYDDERAGYVQGQEDREIRSVLEFEAPLARYGNWVPSRFGRAWHPRVGTEWRPYTVGRWVDSADGQTWESDEPWGWATYHDGRWGFDDRWGWVWVPDIEWAPAWVAWRDGDQYSGWAPLPPRAGYGYDVDAWDYSQWYAPSWIYVPRAYLYRRNVGSVALPWRGGRNYWNVTRGSYRDRGPSRDYGGQRGPRGYDRGPGRPGGGLPPVAVRPGQPPQGGRYPDAVRPQDGRPWQARPGDNAGRPDRNRPDRAGNVPANLNPPDRSQPDRSQPDRGQNPRPDRRPGYVPLGGNPGQPQSGFPGRGGRGGAATMPGSAPAPVAIQRPRPPAPTVAAAPQVRPSPPAEARPRSPVNPRLDRDALRKPD